MEARCPQDLVGVGVPDAGDELVVHEEVAQLAPRRLGALRELVRGPRERAGLRALLGELRHGAIVVPRAEQVDLAHPRVVAIAQVAVTLERERERRGRADLRLSGQQVEESGQHRIHHQPRAVVEGEGQEPPAM